MDTPAHTSPPDGELTDRVVAWHNRHWLTSRIDASQVTGLGIVALPFVAGIPAAGQSGLAARLHARLRRPQAAFDKPLVQLLDVSRTATFGWRHGAPERPGAADWPLRMAAPCDGASAADVQWRHLRTAAIEVGSRRIRVLVGAHGAAAPVLGARYWSRPRLHRLLATAAGVLVLAAGTALAAWLEASDPDATMAADRPAPVAVAASAAASATSTVAGSTPLPDDTIPIDAIVAADDAAPLPAAADQSASLAPDGTPDRPASAAAAPAPPAPASAAAPAATTWALATEPTRSRAGSQLRIMLMNAPTEPRTGRAHAELMQTEAGWRAVLWPFATRDAADRVRQTLEQRGVRVELVAF